MKTDKFVKIMLVIITGILLVNFFSNTTLSSRQIPFIETSVSAATPSFIQVGKTYKFGMVTSEFISPQIKVATIDKEGWVQDTGGQWINLDQVISILEVK